VDRSGSFRPVAAIRSWSHTDSVAIRTLFALLCLFWLGGCSYNYDLLAVVIHGRLAFIVDPQSKRGATCITSIHVQTNDVARARPAVADNKNLVANGFFWWRDYDVADCPNRFPILYGQPLVGKPFVYSSGRSDGVEAKPLKVGVIYEVSTASGSGYGGGRFRILPDRRVENLPREDDTAEITVPANDS
jgi:hypothetical protein